jgi:hypothetical protein
VNNPTTSFRSALAVIGLLMIEACTSAEGPPGKSQAKLDFENNLCSRSASRASLLANIESMYAQCMLNFGNTVHLADGRTLEPRQYAYALPPTYTPSPQYIPPATYTLPPEPMPQEKEDTPSKPNESPSGSPVGEGWLTVEVKKQLIDVGLAEAENAGTTCLLGRILNKRPFFKCFAITWVFRVGERVGKQTLVSTICKNPNMLQGISSKITPDLQSEIVEQLKCGDVYARP